MYTTCFKSLQACRPVHQSLRKRPPTSYIPVFTENVDLVTWCEGILEHGMVKDATSELHLAAIQAMLEAAADCPAPFAALYKGQLTWLKSFLSHTDATGVDLNRYTLATLAVCNASLTPADQPHTNLLQCFISASTHQPHKACLMLLTLTRLSFYAKA